MPIPTITPLPAAPTRADSASFDSRADALMTALPPFVEEINAAIDGIAATGEQAEANTATILSKVDEAALSAASASESAASAGLAKTDAQSARAEAVEARDVTVAARDTALSHSQAASASAQAAAISADAASAVTGLPVFSEGDAGKAIVVSQDCSGYSLEMPVGAALYLHSTFGGF